MQTILNVRFQNVKINYTESQLKETGGAPQGSDFGPMIYIWFKWYLCLWCSYYVKIYNVFRLNFYSSSGKIGKVNKASRDQTDHEKMGLASIFYWTPHRS